MGEKKKKKKNQETSLPFPDGEKKIIKSHQSLPETSETVSFSHETTVMYASTEEGIMHLNTATLPLMAFWSSTRTVQGSRKTAGTRGGFGKEINELQPHNSPAASASLAKCPHHRAVSSHLSECHTPTSGYKIIPRSFCFLSISISFSGFFPHLILGGSGRNCIFMWVKGAVFHVICAPCSATFPFTKGFVLCQRAQGYMQVLCVNQTSRGEKRRSLSFRILKK